MSDDDLFDDFVRDRMVAAAGHVAVDVDDEWSRLLDRLVHEERELATLPPAPTRPPILPRLLAVAAVVVLLLLLGRPVMRVTIDTARFVQDVVDGDTSDRAATTPPAPTTTVAPVVVPTTAPPPPPTTAAPPPPTPPPPPPPTTTTAPPATDLAHAPVPSDDEYRLTVRRVHNSINAAIGYGNLNFDALEGSDARLERLLGLQPRFDPRLRDTIGHLREAQRNRNRDAASRAHSIIESIEQELALEAQR